MFAVNITERDSLTPSLIDIKEAEIMSLRLREQQSIFALHRHIIPF